MSLTSFQTSESRAPAMTITRKGDQLAFRGVGFQAVFDTRLGVLSELDFGNGPMLEKPLKPVIRFAGQTPELRLDRILRALDDQGHGLTCFFKCSGIQGHLVCHYQIGNGGDITVEAAVKPRKPLIAFDFDEGHEKDQPLPAGQIHQLRACIRKA